MQRARGRRETALLGGVVAMVNGGVLLGNQQRQQALALRLRMRDGFESEAVAEVALAALDRDPDERYPSVADFGTEFVAAA